MVGRELVGTVLLAMPSRVPITPSSQCFVNLDKYWCHWKLYGSDIGILNRKCKLWIRGCIA